MILEALSYSRAAVDQGEWWRLVTASLAHLSWAHVLGNLLGVLLLMWGLGRLMPWPRQLLVILVGAIASGLGIHLLSDLSWYAGLSGALWAVAGCAAVRLSRQRILPGRAMLSLLALMVFLDQYRTLSWLGEPLAAQGHLYGFVAGIGCALLEKTPVPPRRHLASAANGFIGRPAGSGRP